MKTIKSAWMILPLHLLSCSVALCLTAEPMCATPAQIVDAAIKAAESVIRLEQIAQFKKSMLADLTMVEVCKKCRDNVRQLEKLDILSKGKIKLTFTSDSQRVPK